MGLRSDGWIAKMATECGMIDPFVPGQVKEREYTLGDSQQARQTQKRGVISYGVSSYGYDIRVGREFKVFTNVNGTVVDPKAFDPSSFICVERDDYCIIPPNSFALARSVEYIRMPIDTTGIVLCKSTYIRAGILIPTTVLEAGWEGEITLEIANVTPLPAKVYVNEGIAQVLFFTGDDPCLITYADRSGKYQNQTGVVPPRV